MQSAAILILTTGGTIDKQYFDALSRYQVTETVIERLIAVARVHHPYSIEEVFRKDSLDLTEADRSTLSERVRHSGSSRIIITHGTDTMTETAQALAGVSDKTIVLTGALVPARFTESDAAFNLGMAFAAAQTALPGVYITINGWVFDARTVIKDRKLGRFVLSPQSDS